MYNVGEFDCFVCEEEPSWNLKTETINEFHCSKSYQNAWTHSLSLFFLMDKKRPSRCRYYIHIIFAWNFFIVFVICTFTHQFTTSERKRLLCHLRSFFIAFFFLHSYTFLLLLVGNAPNSNLILYFWLSFDSKHIRASSLKYINFVWWKREKKSARIDEKIKGRYKKN